MRALIFAVFFLCAGCATYVTPGGAAPLEQLNRAEVADGTSRQPAPQLPADIAVVRVQASPYRSYSSEGFGAGRFSVITARDVLPTDELQMMAKWPSIQTATLLNGAWLPEKLESIDDLRGVAAKMQADVLLVYTIDTTFKIQGQTIKPDGSIALGEKAAGPATVESPLLQSWSMSGPAISTVAQPHRRVPMFRICSMPAMHLMVSGLKWNTRRRRS